MSQDVCLVTGVGPGTGSALVRRFAESYQVAMIARNEDRLRALEDEIDGATAFPCDVSDVSALRSTFEKIVAELGSPGVLLHNAVGGAFGDFLSIDPAVLEVIDIDGVRARFKDGWGLLRASNTQPVLVMRFEGSDAEKVELYQNFFNKLLEKVSLELKANT